MSETEYRSARYRRLKFAGICTYCGKAPALEDRILCAACKEQHAQYYRDHKGRMLQGFRDRRERLIKQGLCVCCGKSPAQPGRTMCQPCRDHINMMTREQREKKRETEQAERRERKALTKAESAKNRRERLRAEGICIICGRNPAREGYTTCFDCAIRRSNLRMEREKKKHGG